MKIITRAEAAEKIRSSWLKSRTREQLLAMSEPRWARMRNYELEQMLEEEFLEPYVIGEWCPFNGVHCAWVQHCPIAELDAIIAEWEANPDALRKDGINAEMAIGNLRNERQKRAPSDQTRDASDDGSPQSGTDD